MNRNCVLPAVNDLLHFSQCPRFSFEFLTPVAPSLCVSSSFTAHITPERQFTIMSISHSTAPDTGKHLSQPDHRYPFNAPLKPHAFVLKYITDENYATVCQHLHDVCSYFGQSFIKCTEPINTTAKAVRLKLWRERLEPLDASVHLNISADEHLPAGADYPWTTWKALNRLRTQVGRSRVNMSKWGYSNETETCDCGIRQTMQHLLVCPMMDTACSPHDLTTANGIAIDYAKHWEGTI